MRHTIRQTCTSAFAQRLLTQPVSVPNTQRTTLVDQPAEPGHFTYTGSASLGPGPPDQIVLATYHTMGHPNEGGRLTIKLTGSRAGWRAAGLG